MILSIPVSDFIDPPKGSRAWNAINRAIDLAPLTKVELIGELRGERYFRVRAKSHDRHTVVRWYSELEKKELVSCDCPAFIIPVTGPTHCFHVASVLIHESTQPEQKLPSMGRKNDVRTSTATF
jgi:hypothetical protein